MEGKAARIARYAILAVFLLLGLAWLRAVLLLWSGQSASFEPTPANLLFGLGGAMALAWMWAAWAALLRGHPVALCASALLLACFTALDVGAAACLAGAPCRLPSAPGATLHVVIWVLAGLGAVLATRERRCVAGGLWR